MSPLSEQNYIDLLRPGNYLGALRVLQQQRWPEESMRLQELSWLLGAVGRYREVQQAFNQAMGAPDTPTPPSAEEQDAIDAVPLEPADEVVLRVAAAHQIVIVNEMHHQVEHRLFGAGLISRLKAVGVNYVAWETGKQALLDEAMKTGRVTLEMACEPQQAEFLRAILRAGMQLVAFDFMRPEEESERRREPSRGQALRETAMARNIEELILRRDPAAKILIWAGGSHGAKTPQWDGTEWMALCFWRRTGIEPFSLFQMSDSGHPGYTWSLYRLLVQYPGRPFPEPRAVSLPTAGFSAKFPEVLLQHPIYTRVIEHGVDAIILHPPDPFENGPERPAWLRPEGAAEIRGSVHREEVPQESCLVQALPEAEGDGCAPADQVLTDPEGQYQLRVRPGRYRLQIWAPAERAGDEQIAAALPAIRIQAHQTVQRDVRLPPRD